MYIEIHEKMDAINLTLYLKLIEADAYRNRELLEEIGWNIDELSEYITHLYELYRYVKMKIE